jgi:hypothetical protein
VSGNIELRTGIGERGIALAPNSIVLPDDVEHLPMPLIVAAQRVLGQAFSIATAPAGGLPAEVLYVKRQTVFERGRDLGAAGQRVFFGEPLERVVWDLLLDWMGHDHEDEGFEQLLRQTDAGREFLGEIAAIAAGSLGATDLLDLQRGFVDTTVARAPHASVVVGHDITGAPLRLELTNASDDVLGSGSNAVTGSAFLPLVPGAEPASMIVLSEIADSPYRLLGYAEQAGVVDLGISLPGETDEIVHLRYPEIGLALGDRVRVTLLFDGSFPDLEVDENGDGSIDRVVSPIVDRILEGAPTVLAVRQLEQTSNDGLDPAVHGLLIAALFDKPVQPGSAQTFENYRVESNAVIAAAPQPRDRLVYLYLERPIGTLVDRTIELEGILDVDGRALALTTLPIDTRLVDGAMLIGQVRTAEGDAVSGAVLELKVQVFDGRDLKEMVVSRVTTLGDGSFEFDYVSRDSFQLQLTAQHPVSGNFARQSAKVTAQGQTLLLYPTFRGAGRVRGTIRLMNGIDPAPGADVALIPAVPTAQQFLIEANDLGEYVFDDVPVGPYRVQARNFAGGWGEASGVVATSGIESVTDIDLNVAPDRLGRLEGRVFAGDGVSPAAGVAVYVGTLERGTLTIAAVAQGQADGDGYFSFDRIPPPPSGRSGWEVIAVDLATTQVGVTAYTFVIAATATANVRLEGAGIVEGIVLNAQGQRVEGALVAGGLDLVTTDADGFFRIENVPGGDRTLEAGDPINKRIGEVRVSVIPGQVVNATIQLEGRATVAGRVSDEFGEPEAGVSVRIPVKRGDIDGYIYVITDREGNFEFPDLEYGSYLLQAPGPSAAVLIERAHQAGVDPRLSYTLGDYPPELDDEPALTSSINPLLAANVLRARAFSAENPDADPNDIGDNGFGWARAELRQDGDIQIADIQYLSRGGVSGNTMSADGAGVGALVRVTGLAVASDGKPLTRELGRTETDPSTGAFAFDDIPVYSPQAFLASGVRSGSFSIEAISPFYPIGLHHSGVLTLNEPNQNDIELVFADSQETNGTISGTVYLPDGETPAPDLTLVRISFGDLAVQTDAEGRFETLFEIPAGTYRVEAEEPGGLRGIANVVVPAGGNVEIEIRLLGVGTVTVDVEREDGTPVEGATVALSRGSYPRDRADGITDATGRLRFENISEGPFSLSAVEAGTGLSGMASGVIELGGEVAVRAVVAPAGRVEGIFLAADGTTPIANAQVELRAGAIRGYTVTNDLGRFEIDGVRARIPILIFALDPLTGRSGTGSGQIDGQDQTTEIVVIQGPQGFVEGRVLRADGISPLPGASVLLVASGYRVQVSVRADASFFFAGVPGGGFVVSAGDPLSGFRGSASGIVAFDGDIARADILLAGWGSIEGQVFDYDGDPSDNALVAIGLNAFGTVRSNIGVDAEGRFQSDYLPLGGYTIRAHSIADADDRGETPGVVLSTPDEVTSVRIDLGGIGDVEVLVVDSDGTTPISGVSVRLDSRAGDGGFAFTNSSGLTTIRGIAPGQFSVQAEIGPLGGSANGVVETPGVTVPITVMLSPAGALAGRVLLSDGMTAAVETLVTIDFEDHGGANTTLQVRTDVLGDFSFMGVPLGPISLLAFEPVSRGVASFIGELINEGETLDVGTLVLDSESPIVLGIEPGDGAAAVSLVPSIEVEFSEPINSASISLVGSAANVVLSALGVSVPIGGGLSPDGTLLTIVPVTPLESDVLHTLSIRGVPDGPRDAADLSLANAFVSSFTTADAIPPSIISTSPDAAAIEVLPEAVVRLEFSEALGDGFAFDLETEAGAPVATRLDLALGDSVAILTPLDFLEPNAIYTVNLIGVADRAGNPLIGGDQSFDFATVDTLGPVLAALELQGAPILIGGSVVSLRPTLPGEDTTRVEYAVTGSASAVVANNAPFEITVPLPVGGGLLSVSAVAVDSVGNRSSSVQRTIAYVPNAPPSVQLVSLSGTGSVGAGQTLRFSATANDDLALQQLVFSSAGVVASNVIEPVLGAVASYTTQFEVVIPGDAPADSVLTVQVAAVDSVGQSSAPALLTFALEDAVRPTLSINSPPAGSQVVAGTTIDVVLQAGDDVELASIELDCTPNLAGCELRALPADRDSAIETFQLTIPQDLVAPASVGLVATARDRAGNLRTVVRSVQVADTVAPTLDSLAIQNETGQWIPGQRVELRADASDNVAIAQIDFVASGAHDATFTAAIEPPSSAAGALWSFVIPETAETGSTIEIRAAALDTAGNQSADVTVELTVSRDLEIPTVAILTPAEAAEVALSALDVSVSAADDTAVARVVFELTGSLVGTGPDGQSLIERLIEPAASSTQVEIQLQLTLATPVGVGRIDVTAYDTSGNASLVATRSILVIDTRVPNVFLEILGGGTSFDPGTPIAVRVAATDNVGVSEIQLTSGGELAFDQLRAITPAASAAIETFSLVYTSPPKSGDQLTLRGSARDAEDNNGNAPTLVIQILDIVAPEVQSVVPLADSEDNNLDVPISIVFDEPMDPASFTPERVSLIADGVSLAIAPVLLSDEQTLRFNPTAALSEGALVTVRVEGTVTDVAGVALGEAYAFSFTTFSDEVGPQVLSIFPSDASTNVHPSTEIEVRFTKTLDAASVNPLSFVVQAAGEVIAGEITLLQPFADEVIFTPDAALPVGALVSIDLGAGITGLDGAPLADAAGAPVTVPLHFEFTVAQFAIVRPIDGATVREKTSLTIQAEVGSGLDAVRVHFQVNGVTEATIRTAPYQFVYEVPEKSVTDSLQILALVFDSETGGSVAADIVVVSVESPLLVEPRGLGIALGESRTVRFHVTSVRDTDLTIDLSAADATVVSHAAQVVIPAGESEAFVDVTGLRADCWPAADGWAAPCNTTLLATSSIGQVESFVSVSTPIGEPDFAPTSNAVGTRAHGLSRAGRFIIPASAGEQFLELRVLAIPKAVDIPVTITSSDLLLLTVTPSAVVPAGETSVIVSFNPVGGAGEVDILVDAGEPPVTYTIQIDDHPADIVPIRGSKAVGVTLFPASGGQQPLTLAPNGLRPVRLRLLPVPLAEDLIVQISSSDASLLGVPSEITILAGETDLVLPVTVGAGTLPDGEHIQLIGTARAFSEFPNGQIVRIDFTDGRATETFNGPPGFVIGDGFTGLAVRPSTGSLFVTDGLGTGRFVEIDLTTGLTIRDFASPAGGMTLDGLAFLNNTLFALQYGGGVLWQINPDTGVGSSFGSAGLGTIAGGLAGADGRLFSRGSGDQIIAERSPTTGEILSSFTVPFAARVRGLAFDGTHLYASSGNGRIYQLDPDTGAVTDQMALGFELDGLEILPSSSTRRGNGTIGVQVGDVRIQIEIVVDSVPSYRLPVQSANVGTRVHGEGSGGRLYLQPDSSQLILLRVLQAPLATPLVVTATSANEAIIDVVSADPIAAGDTSTFLNLVAGEAGETTLRVEAGEQSFKLDVVIGFETPAPILAPPVGARVLTVSAGGSVVVPTATNQGMRIRLFVQPVAVDTAVTITSSDSDVAEVLGSVIVPAGEVDAVLTLSAGSEGSATFTIRAGEVELSIEVEVGPVDVAPRVGPAIGVDVLSDAPVG